MAAARRRGRARHHRRRGAEPRAAGAEAEVRGRPAADAGRAGARLGAGVRGRPSRRSTSAGMLPPAAVAGIRALAHGHRGRPCRAAARSPGARSRARSSGSASPRAPSPTRATSRSRSLATCARRSSTVHGDAAERVSDATRDGVLLRGEVLARWQDFVGTSDVFRTHRVLVLPHPRPRHRVVPGRARAARRGRARDRERPARRDGRRGRARGLGGLGARAPERPSAGSSTGGADLAHPSPELSERASDARARLAAARSSS